MNELQLIKTFVLIDDFCKRFLSKWTKSLIGKSGIIDRKDCLKTSEIITILILFNSSNILYFKSFYLANFDTLKKYFPKISSYNRFVLLQKKAFIPLMAFSRFLMRFARKNDVYFIDSTSIPVCRNQRIKKHKIFKDFAERGKTSMGWFFGFKLHIIINERGKLINLQVSKGNIHDTKPVKELAKGLKGYLIGDKGYLSKTLKEDLFKEQDLQLITRIRKDMKPQIMPLQSSFYLQKRGIIETIIGHLKDFKHLVSSKYRSTTNFFINIFSSITAYQLEERKPNLGLKLRLEM